jgi:S-formylglutathione hydrolase FrmB
MNCNSRLVRLAFFLTILLSSRAVLAQSRIDCSSLNSEILKRSVHYCVYVPAAYDEAASQNPPRQYPVLYFFHGLGDNEQTLFNSGVMSALDDLRKQHKIVDFLMVAPEGRRSFYINSVDGSVRYNDFFLQEFMPHIEHKYHVRPGATGRAVSGISMGGYGALRLAFSHPELFSAVSAQSAALITASPQELDSVSQSGGELASVLAQVFGNPINLPHWNDNNPLVLAKRNAPALQKLAIYFNCGQDDDFGFEKGAEMLHDELRKEKVKHEYHAYDGDHSFNYFMSHFAEVMEFHSKAFAKAVSK